jgi:hypothetical protein
MSINLKVRVGVEWINVFPHGGDDCDQHDLSSEVVQNT